LNRRTELSRPGREAATWRFGAVIGSSRSAAARRRAAAPAIAVSILVAAAGLGSSAAASAADAPPPPTPSKARVVNLAPNLIGTDAGIPPKPGAPLRYGPPAVVVDDHGDAVDAHDGKLAFFEGKYWWYGTAYGCGWQYKFPTPSAGSFCGFTSYSSTDLEHWHRESLFVSPKLVEACSENGCFDPRVVYSPKLHRYLMWFFRFSPQGPHYYVAESKSPGGPWRNLSAPSVSLGWPADFDIFIDDAGRGWLVVDDVLPPNFDRIYVYRLTDDLRDTTGVAHEVSSGAAGEGPSMFQRGDTYYIAISDPPCSYCGTGTGYFMAKKPLGRWHDADGVPGEDTLISGDSCGGQPRTVSELPTRRGPVYLAQIDLWRTSRSLTEPGNNGPPSSEPVNGGDENQAIAGRYWTRLRFRANGTIRPIACQRHVRVPLAPRHTAAAPSAPVYQVDCRASSGSTMRQRLRVRGGRALRALDVALFQRAKNDSAITSPLDVSVLAGGKLVARRSFRPGEIASAPRREAIRLRRPASGKIAVRLSSDETRGCYGGLVGYDPSDVVRYAADKVVPGFIGLGGIKLPRTVMTPYPHTRLLYRAHYCIRRGSSSAGCTPR
jgi:hypothetical protein